MPFHLKRIYDPPRPSDGVRILVDRVWPRGVKKGRADAWLKDLAPSTKLRKWFDHDPKKWPEFKRRYFHELKSQTQSVSDLSTRATNARVTLLYAAKNQTHNNAVALLEYLQTHSKIK